MMGRFFDRISARFHTQEQKGIEKYGTVLEDNHGDFPYRLEHLAQELTDGLMYVEWLKEAGQIVSTMFELLAEDIETADICPLCETVCEPKDLPEGGCFNCLQEHYITKAREKFGIILPRC